MAAVLAFPLARRRDLIRRQAASYTRLPEKQAESHLGYQVALQGQVLARKGVAADQVEAEVRSLEVAIRCEVARSMGTVGDVA